MGVEGVEDPESVLRAGLGRDYVEEREVSNQLTDNFEEPEGSKTWSGNICFCRNKFARVMIAVCTRS